MGEEREGRVSQVQETMGTCWSSCLPETEKRPGSWSEESEGSMVPAEVGEGDRRERQVTISLPCLEFPVTLDIRCHGPVDVNKWVK